MDLLQTLGDCLTGLRCVKAAERVESNPRWCTDIQRDSALLTPSGQLTSLTDKILVLHLNQLPIKLMVSVPQLQTTPIRENDRR